MQSVGLELQMGIVGMLVERELGGQEVLNYVHVHRMRGESID